MLIVLHAENHDINTEFVNMIGTVCGFTINTRGDIRMYRNQDASESTDMSNRRLVSITLSL